MTDLTKLSDAELMTLYHQSSAPTPSASAAPMDLTKLSDTDLLALRDAHPSVTSDVVKSGASGLARGALELAGFVPKVSAIAHDAANKYVIDPVLDATFGKPKATAEPSIDINKLASPDSLQRGVEQVTGKFYEPKTTAGKFVHSAAEAVPMGIAAPGSMAGRMASAVGSGLASEAAGQTTEGTKWEPWARIVGAFAGGVAPMMAGRVVTPLPSNPARQRLVDVLNDEGVTSLTAGQRTGNKSLQYLESAASTAPGAGGGATRIQEEGQRQFTQAAMRRAGQGLPDAAPEVLAQNNQRLGQEFRDLSARNNLAPDNQFVDDIVNAARNYRRVPDSQQRQMVQGYIDDIIGHVNAGNMPGPQYQEMRSRLSRQANSLRQSDPTLSEALRDMRNALDGAMGRSISPQDQAAWQSARREYAAQKTIEKAASRAGEATAEGQIVPANLRNTVAAENRGAYARGEGPFSELARAGSAIMAPLPNSGTAQRLNAFNLLNQATLGVVPAVAGRVVMSAPVQSWLANQALAAAMRAPETQRRAVFLAFQEAARNKLLAPVQD